MPDVTMCLNQDCPIRKTCYRFTAKPKEYAQSYAEFKFDPIKRCRDFHGNGWVLVDVNAEQPKKQIKYA